MKQIYLNNAINFLRKTSLIKTNLSKRFDPKNRTFLKKVKSKTSHYQGGRI